MTRPGWSLLLALWVVRPDEVRLREILRVLPDVIRLLRRLAADSTLPRGIRVRLVLLLACLALPVDLLPDFVPVLGHADDAIIVALVLRSVVRTAGPQALEGHWPAALPVRGPAPGTGRTARTRCSPCRCPRPWSGAPELLDGDAGAPGLEGGRHAVNRILVHRAGLEPATR